MIDGTIRIVFLVLSGLALLGDTRPTQVVGNVRGWTPDVPLKIFLLKPLNTGLFQPVDMKLSVGGMDVGGILPWLQRRISSRRTLHFTF